LRECYVVLKRRGGRRGKEKRREERREEKRREEKGMFNLKHTNVY
jgi:hypothetical protein